jgi:hypothetical protein
MSVATPSPTADDGARRLDHAARLRLVARRLEGHPRAEQVLGTATELEEKVCAAAARARKSAVGSAERIALLEQAVELRVQLDSLIAFELGDALPVHQAASLPQLPQGLDERLAELLGIPLSSRTRPILESFASDWLENGRAFDEVSTSFGFVESSSLLVGEPRGALVLTHHGSILQISAPVDRHDARRFVYQSVYANDRVPAEGTLTLRESVRVGHGLKADALCTSKIRKLRAAPRSEGRGEESWRLERQTFARISRVCTPSPLLGPSPTAWGIVPPAIPPKPPPSSRRRSLLASLAEKLKGSGGGRSTIDVEILGLCLDLQRDKLEAGEPGFELDDVASFSTDRGEQCAFFHEVDGVRVVLVRPGEAPLEVRKTELGGQRIVRGAPLALLGEGGRVLAQLGSVAAVGRRR